MSLGTNADSKILHDAVDKAYKKGIVIVAAAGNDGNKKPVNYPGAYSAVGTRIIDGFFVAVVSCGGYDHDSFFVCFVYGVVKNFAVCVSSEAHIDDVHFVGDRPVDRFKKAFKIACTLSV